jgi:hypothetical protein
VSNIPTQNTSFAIVAERFQISDNTIPLAFSTLMAPTQSYRDPRQVHASANTCLKAMKERTAWRLQIGKIFERDVIAFASRPHQGRN